MRLGLERTRSASGARGFLFARARAGSFRPLPRGQKVFGRRLKDRVAPFAEDFSPTGSFENRREAEVRYVPGKRQPTALVKANGRKHLSKAEEAERTASEPQVQAPTVIVPPKWLAKRFHAEFLEVGQILVDAGIYTDLDRDVLGQYFVAREGWLKANRKAAAAIKADDSKLAQGWTAVQNTYFRQARQCAESMGLSVSSRCRLVVPEGAKQKSEDDNPFLQLIRGTSSGGAERGA